MRRTLEGYPGWRGLRDESLCDLVRRGMVADPDEDLEVGECKYCGEEFRYLRIKRPRVKCEACRSNHKVGYVASPYEGSHGSAYRYVRCVRGSELYWRGNWFEFNLVEQDCDFGYVWEEDFDWDEVRVGVDVANR